MDDNHGLSKFHEHGQITEIQPDYTITQRPHISAGIWDGWLAIDSKHCLLNMHTILFLISKESVYSQGN